MGTRIEGSTSRTSNSPMSSKIRRIVDGLAASRSSRPAHSRKPGSTMLPGATPPATQPSPQCSTSSAIRSSRRSADHAHSYPGAQVARAKDA